jgi:hypothetical protein
MTFITRRSRQYLEIDKYVRIVGGASEAFLVTPARSLVVDGDFTGSAWIEMLGTLEVNGRFAASVESNAGLLLITGILATDTRSLPGVVRVRAGSTIIRDHVTCVLRRDGRLGRVDALHPTPIPEDGPFLHLNDDRWTFSQSRSYR